MLTKLCLLAALVAIVWASPTTKAAKPPSSTTTTTTQAPVHKQDEHHHHEVHHHPLPKVTSLALNNGRKMPALGLGTWRAEGKDIETALDAALQAGYRHIDTATRYGNEAAIGKVLKKWFTSGKIKREDLFVVTKLPPTGNRRSGVKKFLTRSLQALQLDYVDMYLVHTPMGVLDPEENNLPADTYKFDHTTDLIGIWKAEGDNLEAALEKALEDGYRHIDTATVYGNEAIIGKVLKKWLSSGKIKREELFIVTKLPSSGNRPAGVKKFLTKSLQALNLNYVDMYLIHSPMGNLDPEETKLAPGQSTIDKSTNIVAIWKSPAQQLEPALEAALEAGYRHIDTATAYGNEDAIGRVVNKWIKAGKLKREDLFITTKLPPSGNSPAGVKKFLSRSLKLMNLDYIDMYLVHMPIGFQDRDEYIDFINVEVIDYNFKTDLVGMWKAESKELEPAIETALEAGYRHIDAAAAYANEDAIGRVLKRWIDSGKLKREDLFIVTKLPPSGNRPAGVNKFLTKSLKDLQIDYVDMYLVHTPFGFNDVEGDLHPVKPDGTMDFDHTTDHVAVWKAMEEEVTKGRAKSIGISNFNQTQIERILKVAKVKPSNLQIELHAYHQQNPLVDFCKKNNIIVTAYSPLGSPGLSKFLEDKFGAKVELPDILGNPVIKEIAKKHKKSPAQVLLRQIVQRGIVAIPKSTNAGRLKENINVFDFELDRDDMAKIKALDQYPKARLLDFTNFKGVKDHPEYPWHNE